MNCIACNGHNLTSAGFNATRKYPVLRCEDCGLSLLAGCEDSEEQFDEYWDDVNARIYTDPSVVAEMKRKFQRYLPKLEELAPNRRLLDVGSGIGIFVRAAREAGFDAEGVEPSEKAVELCRSIDDISVTRDLLRLGDDLPTDFGVLSLWDVIEHVPDPLLLLQTIYEHMADQGVLILETPYENSLLRKLITLTAKMTFGAVDLRSKIYYRAHRYYFSDSAMRLVLESSGFSDVRIYRDYTQFEKSIQKLRYYQNLSPGREKILRSAYWIISRLPFMANKMVVICKKRSSGGNRAANP